MQRLANWLDIEKLPKVRLNAMQLDSRAVNAGDVFVALKGHHSDGRNFIANAIENGAVLVLAQSEKRDEHLHITYEHTVPVVHFYQLDRLLSQIAGDFYGNPSKEMCLIGVTGTNGKTTVAHLLTQWAALLGKTAAVMGTIGNGLYGNVKSAVNTTGSAVEVQANLHDFCTQGAQMAVMEVSSHGLVQHRVEALQFDAAIFTNLSRDHLDYHHTMQAYADAKYRLFSELNVQHRIINYDDPIGKQWLEKLPSAVAVSCQPINHIDRTFVYATHIDFHSEGARIEFDSSWGNGVLESNLIGPFNVSNLLLVTATLLQLGYPLTALCETVTQLFGVCGRMEMFGAPLQPTVIVDYAHTPDALEKALQAAKMHCEGQLWCVFGCGGDRDKGKRPLMAQAAERFADKIVITDDNPRTEDPEQILSDIQEGLKDSRNAVCISGREQAIYYAITQATFEDVVVVAGKGHEDYQIIGTEKYHFSDREVVCTYLEPKTYDETNNGATCEHFKC
ncbi:UDP-N-acetylmuramoyl-L-alanyl-D-glutamate--2,6-diaminopimelate ligase [Spirabiliibacterium falconis]|uniref:UDP-N-acetylmuramoyl-L-alanyl-D-glutamate--2, 6-diaminopimelate ligase n=1 Tax=Spirabiliibacterium falconis TaxID=572023 RepID=UPI001AADC5B5|nr:UDP-N-acetylmuramoyl-L-alanyl-D-glutamate--2,6-diaminopimelate ligase [Spirabiliibacterium falconis]MBE2895034.1 UDP-N-acetylmuramoyl-L-alanyl-D-glutamate--2,6-diaminopimelate ligase [Spirabiliibacterium falconis]